MNECPNCETPQPDGVPGQLMWSAHEVKYVPAFDCTGCGGFRMWVQPLEEESA